MSNLGGLPLVLRRPFICAWLTDHVVYNGIRFGILRLPRLVSSLEIIIKLFGRGLHGDLFLVDDGVLLTICSLSFLGGSLWL